MMIITIKRIKEKEEKLNPPVTCGDEGTNKRKLVGMRGGRRESRWSGSRVEVVEEAMAMAMAMVMAMVVVVVVKETRVIPLQRMTMQRRLKRYR